LHPTLVLAAGCSGSDTGSFDLEAEDDFTDRCMAISPDLDFDLDQFCSRLWDYLETRVDERRYDRDCVLNAMDTVVATDSAGHRVPEDIMSEALREVRGRRSIEASLGNLGPCSFLAPQSGGGAGISNPVGLSPHGAGSSHWSLHTVRVPVIG
jgi:hypothetical protein